MNVDVPVPSRREPSALTVMRRLVLIPVLALLATIVVTTSNTAEAQDAEWPTHRADWFFEIVKDPEADPVPFEPWDLQWMHLHRNHTALPDAPLNVIAPRIFNGHDERDTATLDVEVRYVVRDVPVSGWIGAPFRFDLEVGNDGLAQLPDGVHGLTIEARGPDRSEIRPIPAFVHVTRDLADGQPFGFTRSVPIVSTVQEFPRADRDDFGPGIVYVDPDERRAVGYPVNPSATPWSTPPDEADLYQELMSPHSELFLAVQMWWDHPAHSDAPFIRGLTPKHGEDHRFLRVEDGHERFPMQDGPRGVGWMSPYVSGQVDSQGRFAFAEAGGRVGYLMPDGEIITIAGWRVQPGRDPIWWEKPTEVVRRNMENRGTWTAGRGEFHTPLDVAVDPRDEQVLYVAAWEDNVIWRIDVPDDPRTQEATVSILAGDPNHEAGFVDGQGSAARFNGIGSLVFDPVADVLYIADQDNDAIRQVDRSGNVTTLAGEPGMQERLTSAGVEWFDQQAARAATQFEVTSAEAANGVRPDIYRPQSIRVDSEGRIILLELGYGAIRRIDPATLVTETLGEVGQKHQQWSRGWAWLDVDRWGNSGPQDGIYWAKFVSTKEDENFNEVFEWLPPDGGESVPLFPHPTGLYPDGWGRRSATNAPHYAWLVAVDPRGGVLLSGGGEHGLTRLRPMRSGDPVEEREDYWLGRTVWATGAPVGAPVASRSTAMRYGWGGHNHLGLTDAWALEGVSDEELLNAFDIPEIVRNDVDARRQVLAFIRPNTIGATNPGPGPGPGPEPEPEPASVAGRVSFVQGGAAEAVVVDLFEATADGQRGQWLGDQRTGADGTFGFEVGSGCYVATIIAPEGRSFVSSGRWYQQSRCVEAGQAAPSIDAELTGGPDGALSITGTVVDGGGGVPGVLVDLFEAGADGSRGRWLGDRETDGDGRFDHPVGSGCYVVTVIAPDGRSFDGGGQWYQVGRCANVGSPTEPVAAVLG